MALLCCNFVVKKVGGNRVIDDAQYQYVDSRNMK